MFRELENMNKQSANYMNNVLSSDKLSYSQTINLNNLVSNENLRSNNEITALNYKLGQIK